MSKDAYKEYEPKYHGTGVSYVLPLDNHEQDRIVDQHRAWRALMSGKIVHAPIVEPKLIVDIGCGPGSVTRELAAQFPAAQVKGVDLVELPEVHAERPANVEFIQGDIKDLLEPSSVASTRRHLALDAVDYVFERLLICGMTDWPGYVRTLVGAVKPGCWVEMHEWDFHLIREDGADVTDEWPWQKEMIIKAKENKGLDLRSARGVAGWMRDAGLVDIQTVDYKATIGDWDTAKNPQTGAMALYFHKWWPSVCWHLLPKIMHSTVDAEVIKAYQEQMVKDFAKAEKDERKAYGITVCYGRKP